MLFKNEIGQSINIELSDVRGCRACGDRKTTVEYMNKSCDFIMGDIEDIASSLGGMKKCIREDGLLVYINMANVESCKPCGDFLTRIDFKNGEVSFVKGDVRKDAV